MFKCIHTLTVSCFKRETWGEEPRNPSYDKTGWSCTALDSNDKRGHSRLNEKCCAKNNKVTNTWCFREVTKSLLTRFIWHNVHTVSLSFKYNKSQMQVLKSSWFVGTAGGQSLIVYTQYLPYCTILWYFTSKFSSIDFLQMGGRKKTVNRTYTTHGNKQWTDKGSCQI